MKLNKITSPASKWRPGLVLTCLLFGAMGGSAAEPESMVVFEKGEEFGYRIPSLVVTTKGTVLAFAERRVGLHDHAQNDYETS